MIEVVVQELMDFVVVVVVDNDFVATDSVRVQCTVTITAIPVMESEKNGSYVVAVVVVPREAAAAALVAVVVHSS